MVPLLMELPVLAERVQQRWFAGEEDVGIPGQGRQRELAEGLVARRHAVLGDGGQVLLCSLSEAGRPQGEAHNQRNKVTKLIKQSLAPLRFSLPQGQSRLQKTHEATQDPNLFASW